MKRKIITIITLLTIAGVCIMAAIHSSDSHANVMENSQPETIPGSYSRTDQTNEELVSMTSTNGLAMAWRFFFEKNNRTPDRPMPFQPVDLNRFNERKKDRLTSTWLGHSSLMINMGGYRILTDPVFDRKVSIVGPKRFNQNFSLDPGQLTSVEVVIISHDHYDHLNKSSIRMLAPITSKFIVPVGVGNRLQAWGVPSEKIVQLSWWQTFHFDDNLTVIATPAQHFSGRGLRDRNTTLWASWVINSPSFNLFFSGDSGYFDGFKKIGEKFGPFDMTFMECGAYDPNWRSVHMFPEQTVQAHMDLKGNVLHPIHWGTFNLAFHSWDDPMKRLVKAAESKQVRIATPMAGQTIDYHSTHLGSHWWELEAFSTAFSKQK